MFDKCIITSKVRSTTKMVNILGGRKKDGTNEKYRVNVAGTSGRQSGRRSSGCHQNVSGGVPRPRRRSRGFRIAEFSRNSSPSRIPRPRRRHRRRGRSIPSACSGRCVGRLVIQGEGIQFRRYLVGDDRSYHSVPARSWMYLC